jgi:outer membrane lipoprotein-sorting protein
MKKIICLIAFVSCLPLISAAKSDVFSGIPYKSASWKSTTTVQSPRETISFEQTVYQKGRKMRTEGKFQNRATNQKENQIIIIDEKNMYSINPDKKQGMKYSLNGPNNPSAAENETYKCREAAKKTGSEKINNIKCARYEYTCRIGKSEIKVTEYRNDKGFPVKTVSKMDRTVTTVEITGLKENIAVPDSKFIPDKAIKFMDMDAIMGGNMKKMMKETQKNKSGQNNDDEDSGGGEEAGQKMMKDMMKGMLGE